MTQPSKAVEKRRSDTVMNKRERAAALRGQLADMTPAFLTCRARGHLWEWDESDLKPIDKNTVREDAYCGRCGAYTWRDQTLRGTPVGGGTKYPDGYALHDTGRLDSRDRDLVRATRLAVMQKAA